MPEFKLIKRTADIRLTAYGRTLAEAIANPAYGMFFIIAELRNGKEKESREVKLNDADTETLLFDQLNSLPSFFNVETPLFKRFDIKLFDGNGLRATRQGEKYDPLRHK